MFFKIENRILGQLMTIRSRKNVSVALNMAMGSARWMNLNTSVYLSLRAMAPTGLA